MGGTATVSPTAALEAIATQLNQLMTDLKADASVNPLHAQEADTHAHHLIQGLSETIKLAEQATTPTCVHGKQPPPDSAGTVIVKPTERLNGKQPVKRQSTLFQHGVVRRGLKTKN